MLTDRTPVAHFTFLTLRGFFVCFPTTTLKDEPEARHTLPFTEFQICIMCPTKVVLSFHVEHFFFMRFTAAIRREADVGGVLHDHFPANE